MWQNIHGHDEIADQFRQRMASGRLASTYLFVGPTGIGKRAFALKLAQGLLCQQPTEHLDPCGNCESCRLANAGNHPDLLQVARPTDKSFIPVDTFIGSPEKRMREGLCHDIGLKPFLGGRRVAIVDDADFLNVEGANALLKTLEEPPPRSVLILIGTSASRQLPTIRSRCQLVRFQPLGTDAVAELLLGCEAATDHEEARRWAEFSQGSVSQAIELADPQLFEFRQELLAALAVGVPNSVRLAGQVSALVDAAGKEAPRRRARLNQIVRFTSDFYRGMMRQLAGAEVQGDAALQSAIVQATATFPGDAETAVACLARCLEATQQISRNANQSTLIECWLDDLERIAGSMTQAAT